MLAEEPDGFQGGLSAQNYGRAGLCLKGSQEEAASRAYTLAYLAVQRRKVRDPLACRACLGRPEITDGIADPNCRHHPVNHEDRAYQYRL